MFLLYGILVLLLFYKYLLKPQLYWRERNVKQSFPIPLLGDCVKTTFKWESVVEMIWNNYKRFDNYRFSGIYQMATPTLIIRDPGLIKLITVKNFDHFVNHMSFPFTDEPLWRKNIIFLKGEEWKNMRSNLSSTFTSMKIRSMFVLMENSAKQFVNFYLRKEENLFELEMKDTFTRIATDVIANCAFGITVDSLKDVSNEFYLHGKDLTNLATFSKGVRLMMKIIFPTLSKLLKIQVFSSQIENFFRNIIRSSIKVRQRENIQRPDLIRIMMEATMQSSTGSNAKLTDEDMAAQSLIFFFAGFETISIILSFTCYELAINPEIQKRLREEIDHTNELTNYKLTYNVLIGMKYLDMVISEGLRKHPPASFLDRVCTKPYTIKPSSPEESSLDIKVGDILFIPIIGLHNDEKHFPEPEKFLPERFSDENKDKIKAYTYLPFGSGPRNCIGSRFAILEVKTILYYLLTYFELIPISSTKIPMKYDVNQFNPGFKGGCWLGLQKRGPK